MAKHLTLTLSVFLLLACSSQTQLVSYDLTEKTGLYIVGYTADENLRRALETQLKRDIETLGMVGFTSHGDLPALGESTRRGVLEQANTKRALAVLVVSQVLPDEQGLLSNPSLSQTDQPDLQSYYETSRRVAKEYVPGAEVFAEVNAYLLEGDAARLIWSGTTWSFEADGQGGAISGVSQNIAAELADIRDTLLNR